MRNVLLFLVIVLSGCRHTEEENYTMINKVIGELTIISDSISYLHQTVSLDLPGSETHIEKDKKGIRYAEDYVSSVMKSGDTLNSKRMRRYAVLNERYNTYKEMFGLIYKELPRDSVAKNEAIKRDFEEAIQ